MKHHLTVRRMAWSCGGVLAAGVLAAAAPGAVAAAAAQTASTLSSPTLTLSSVNLNSATLQINNAPLTLTNTSFVGSGEIPAQVFNGETEMQPVLNGTERAEIFDDSVLMDDLPRGETFNITVKYTDPDTGQDVTTNTLTFSTPPSTDTQPPTTPNNLHFVEEPENGGSPPGVYDLLWNPSRDNVTPSSDIQYVVTANGEFSNGVGSFVKGDVLTVTAIDTSNNHSKPATITFDGKARP